MKQEENPKNSLRRSRAKTHMGNLNLIVVLGFATAFAGMSCSANDSPTVSAETTLILDATASNSSPGFNKYLYSFPLNAPALLAGLTGSISMTSHGQNFAEALIAIHCLPPGNAYPRNGEEYATYPEIGTHYPAMQAVAQFIIKQPSGCSASSIPINLALPAGIPVGGCLVVTLDGSVLQSGGAFTMSSHLTAHFRPTSSTIPAARVVPLDDEFCFGRPDGGELATTHTSPQTAFMHVVPITQTGELLALYGDVSDSAFGPAFGPPVGPGPWAVTNDYYIYHHCALPAGMSGSADFYASIPSDATKLYSLVLHGSGQVALQKAVYHAISGTILQPGDCLVHLIHMTGASDQGGIDAENQVFALVRPVGKAEANQK
jgi:hypothetical protein